MSIGDQLNCRQSTLVKAVEVEAWPKKAAGKPMLRRDGSNSSQLSCEVVITHWVSVSINKVTLRDLTFSVPQKDRREVFY